MKYFEFENVYKLTETLRYFDILLLFTFAVNSEAAEIQVFLYSSAAWTEDFTSVDCH